MSTMKMKLILLFVITFATYAVYAEDKKELSKEEFNKKVQVEVDRQISIIKKKSIAQLTKELLAKERDLTTKASLLDQRAEQVKISETSLLKKIEELEATKIKIIGCLDDHKKGELLRVKQLVSVISGMKPKKAADLLSVQESKISIKIIEQIDPTKASKIFNLMDKEVSARLQKQYLNMQQ